MKLWTVTCTAKSYHSTTYFRLQTNALKHVDISKKAYYADTWYSHPTYDPETAMIWESKDDGTIIRLESIETKD